MSYEKYLHMKVEEIFNFFLAGKSYRHVNKNDEACSPSPL